MNRPTAALSALSLALLGATLPLAACTGSGGGNILEERPRLEVTEGLRPLAEGARIVVTPAGVGGSERAASLRVVNSGTGPLEVRAITLTSDPPGAFSLAAEPLPAAGAPVVIAPAGALEGRTAWTLEVLLEAGEASPPPTATLTLHTNYDIEGVNALTVELVVDAARAALTVSPASVDLGSVREGETATAPLRVTNVGVGPLTVSALRLSGVAGFSVVADDLSSATTAPGEGTLTLAPPRLIPSGESATFHVAYAPPTASSAAATLEVVSDDPSRPVVAVPLSANTGGPCVAINPQRLDFGGRLVGGVATLQMEILSCGTEALVVEGLAFAAASSATFSVDGAALGQLPLTVPVNESLLVPVSYIPEGVAALGGDGKPVADVGALVVTTSAWIPEVEVPLQGWGTDTECMVPVVKVAEGEEVIPQTKLHLLGSQSFAPVGEIVSYHWTVVQPPGSQSVFLPSASAPDPTFEVNAAGTYVFTLQVCDSLGNCTGATCPAAQYTVIVEPDEAIHVELLWDTPGDPDQTDEGPEAGADLDLHFLHPFATGLDVNQDGQPDGWFDNPFDCFWFNPQPDWASHDPFVDDDPGLDRDDTDGAGPENINLDIPEEGAVYRVGVHYWNDHGFGVSCATLRVYIMGVLVHVQEEVCLAHLDLWEAATISWPSGEVTALTGPGGAPVITPNYQHPLFLGN